MSDYNEDLDLDDPQVLSALFPDETSMTVYQRERAAKHKILVDKSCPTSVSRALDEAARLIAEADAVLLVTGAGAGVDMGLPDFRSSNLFWEQLQHPGIHRYEDSSDSKLFETEPAFAWGLNYHQMQLYRSAPVHDGYKAMLRVCTVLKGGDYFCYTSNIDGVLQRAGFDSSRVREIHGSIHRLQCTDHRCMPSTATAAAGAPLRPDAWEQDPLEPLCLDYDAATMTVHTQTTPLPLCRNCHSRLARPNVWLCKDSNYVFSSGSRAVSEAYQHWMEALEQEAKDGAKGAGGRRRRVVVVEVGAGMVIPSARIAAEDAAEELGAALVRINPTEYMVPVPVQPACHGGGDVDSGGDPDTASGAGAGGLRASVGLPMGFAEAMRGIMQRIEPKP